jgi:hypothetical protein
MVPFVVPSVVPSVVPFVVPFVVPPVVSPTAFGPGELQQPPRGHPTKQPSMGG